MVKITEELIRKKSEHNECVIYTLEELSLHQENVDKIEHLQHWCKDLQILLLQGNLISRIENLHKLKALQYLNLALNNIEKIENLEKCESLQKLDLTVNFIGDLESVNNLKNNLNLNHLTLTGNPCTDYKGYREYVICKLPQVQHLDNTDVTRLERLKAAQMLEYIEPGIRAQQNEYFQFRAQQKDRVQYPENDEVPDEVFWKQTSEHCPEVRVEMAKRQIRAKGNGNEKEEPVKEINFFAKDGRPYNMNQPKLKFHLEEYDPTEFILDIQIYKYLDTNLLDIDIQPNYIRISVKKKIFQLALSEEVCIDKSTAQRSQITGNLVVRMPKLNAKPIQIKKAEPIKYIAATPFEKQQRREFLEIGPDPRPDKLTELCTLTEKKDIKEVDLDDPEVPPLE